MASVLCSQLIGRDTELAELRAAVGGLEARRGRVVVVSGEAGVGKSRLVREAVDEAKQAGLPVLLGRAVDTSRPPAYRPLSEALFSYLRRADRPEDADLGPFRGALVRLVPQWAMAADAPEEATFVVLAEAVLRLLRSVGSARGCLLALEDLHWADLETIEVVEYLADNISSEPILVLVTLRSDVASEASLRLQAMLARRAAISIRLRRLNEEQVEAMAETCLGSRSLPAPLRPLLESAAEGLPFLIEEVLAGMVEAGELRHQGDGWVMEATGAPVVPVTLTQTVRRRFDAITGLAEILRPAALLGRRFDWELLAAICASSPSSVLEVLRQAVDVQLLSVDTGETGSRFRFRHALTRQVILDELTTPERTVLAARALTALEAAHPGLPGDHCELAASLAEYAGDPRRAAELYLETGRRCLVQGALSTAEITLDRARRLAGGDLQLCIAVDEALCEVLALAGNNARLEELGDRLITGLTEVSASPEQLSRTHLRLARSSIVADDWSSAARHLHHVEDLGVTSTKAEHDVLVAQVEFGQGRLEEAADRARTALAEAQALRRPDLACEALEVLGRHARQHDLGQAEDAFASALRVADTHGLTLFRIRALHELGTVDLLGGTRVDRLDEARQAALAAGALSTGVTVSLQITAWHLNHFELHQAIDTARTCASEAHRLRMPVTEALGLLMEAGAHALQGEKAEMERAIEQAMAVAGDNPEVRGVAALQMRAAYWFVREERPKAAAELDAGMELLRHTPATAPLRGMWALVHALDAADGDKAVAEVESSGLTVYWLIRGWVGHARAVLLGRRGRLRDAEVAFAEADQTFAGCRWFQLHARRLVAEAALADGWGDPRAWLTEALVFFDQEGYGAVASACRALLRGAGAPVPRQRRPANDAPGPIAHLGFTARELEVLVLLADAQPTREIARRLFLSPKTVERHIANIANKVGVNSRAELIAFAARHMGPGAHS